MLRYEYKIVPSPRKGEKARGARTTPDRFALALTTLMNGLGRDGWEYLRADTLPCDERVGFTGSKTTFQSVLVFRRELVAAVEASGEASGGAGEGKPPDLAATLRAVEAPMGAAPALGPANPDLAAE